MKFTLDPLALIAKDFSNALNVWYSVSTIFAQIKYLAMKSEILLETTQEMVMITIVKCITTHP